MPTGPVRSTPAFVSLLAVVERTRRESADPEVVRDVNAADWLELWLETPTRGLGGVAPVEFITTPDGFDRVQRLLRSELSEASGSYW